MLLGWEHGLNGHEAAEGVALLIVEAIGVAAGVECGGALFGRKLAKGAEAAANGGFLVRRKRRPVARGRANLLALLRREVLHIFIALDERVALLLRHGVELGEAVAHALLRGLRQIVEAGLVFERLLLLRRRKIVVVVHPLFKMFAARSVGAGVGADSRATFAAFNRSEVRTTASAWSRLIWLALRPRLRLILRLTVGPATAGLVIR